MDALTKVFLTLPLSTKAPTSGPTASPTAAPTSSPVTPEPTSLAPITSGPTASAPAPGGGGAQSEWPTYYPTLSPTLSPVFLHEVAPPAAEDEALPECPLPYDPSRTDYVGGEMAEVNLYMFQCHSLYEHYCNVPEWNESLLADNPNAQQMWSDAWVYLGPCVPTTQEEIMEEEVAEVAAVVPAPAPCTAQACSYALSPTCLLTYQLVGGSISMEVVHDDDVPVSWLGLAISPTGGMVGSEAVM